MPATLISFNINTVFSKVKSVIDGVSNFIFRVFLLRLLSAMEILIFMIFIKDISSLKCVLKLTVLFFSAVC